MPIPPGCKLFDFELEVAAIVGRDGYNLTVEEAVGHIAGFTTFNDWSARDLQSYEMRIGLGPAKGKDTASTLGPYLVTPDELGNGCLIEIWGRTGKQDPPPLAIGDVVTMTVDGLGTIENIVVSGAPPHPIPKAPRSAH